MGTHTTPADPDSGYNGGGTYGEDSYCTWSVTGPLEVKEVTLKTKDDATYKGHVNVCLVDLTNTGTDNLVFLDDASEDSATPAWGYSLMSGSTIHCRPGSSGIAFTIYHDVYDDTPIVGGQHTGAVFTEVYFARSEDGDPAATVHIRYKLDSSGELTTL